VASAPLPVADRDRWLALGLLAGALLVAYLVLVHPWWTVPMLEANARIDALQARELRQRMELQQAPQVRERLAQLEARQAGMPGFLPESSAELATAALIQRLETVVAEASPGNRSCVIQNRSPLSEASRDRYPRVVVQARLRCGTPELASVLYAIENGSPRLFVGNLNVLAQRYFFAPGAGDRAPREGGLDVSFDLYGYLAPTPGAANAEVRRAR
jgi:general secretion pathway protein M